ncbi:MAG: thioredoxin domain-containing protein, partial [Alphaproteobacteria bacterium]
MTRNLLGGETSPYLLQHRENPVHWRPWGEAAMAEARTAGRPILLSVGYAACHWCHVMAHESFEDPAIAGVMNDLFVCVKVDREERPDVDAIYQRALALLGQQGGWPLTMFLTPDGEPYWGGTYFPPQPRWGRPGFPDVLRTMADAWRSDPERVSKNVTAIREALVKAAETQAGDGSIPAPLLDRIARRLVRETDPFHGGVGDAPKFPSTPVFQFLWRAWKRSGLEPFRRAVTTTLVQMSQGGIWDHLGGGFSRYSVDERWLVPHFEKMLYDNAQMVDLLTTVWQDERRPLFEARVRETVAWLLREMRAETAEDGNAAFAAALDADSEGVEGRFYVWSETEIDAVLGLEANFFKTVYDVSPGGNWEGHAILNRLDAPDLLDMAAEARLAAARAKLFSRREGRPRPVRDDKVLADWNGLAIAALAGAAAAFDEPEWLEAAEQAFAFVAGRMTAADCRLRHPWCAGRLAHPATLDDHAQMARAALVLCQATGRADYLAHARDWAEAADRHYADPDGGYFMSADDTGDLITRPKASFDDATP